MPHREERDLCHLCKKKHRNTETDLLVDVHLKLDIVEQHATEVTIFLGIEPLNLLEGIGSEFPTTRSLDHKNTTRQTRHTR